MLWYCNFALSGKLQSLTNKQYQVNNPLLLPFCSEVAQVTVKLQGIVKGCDEIGQGIENIFF